MTPGSRRPRIVGRLALVVGLTSVALITVPAVRASHGAQLRVALWAAVVGFTVHWVLRVLHGAATGRAKAYIKSPAGIIDALAVGIIPISFALGAREPDVWLAGSVWVLKLPVASPSLIQLWRVVQTERRTLAGVGGLFLALLVLSGAALFLVEGGSQPETFGTLPLALWWAVVTLSTTGYGDAVPHTAFGRLVGAVDMICGLGLFGLWTGIMATGFAAEGRRRDFLRNWDLVAHVPLFSALSPADIADIARMLRRLELPENTVVFRRGRPGDCMFFVVAGTVEIEIDPPRLLGPGDFFGEIALLDGGPRTATASTVRRSILLVLDIADFRTMAAKHPDVARAIEDDSRKRLGVGV